MNCLSVVTVWRQNSLIVTYHRVEGERITSHWSHDGDSAIKPYLSECRDRVPYFLPGWMLNDLFPICHRFETEQLP